MKPDVHFGWGMFGRRTQARDLVLMVADSEPSEALRLASGQSVGNQAPLLSSLLRCLSHQLRRAEVASHMDVALRKQPGRSSSCLPSSLEALIGSLSPH